MITRVRRNAIIFLLVGGMAVIGAAYVKLSQVTAEVHGAIIRSIAERTQMTLNLFTKPIVDNLLLVKDWSGENRLDLSRISDLNSLFIPILEKFSHISVVIIADSAGAEYRLYHDNGSWTTRFEDPGTGNNKLYFQRWRSPDKATAEWSEPLAYDPRGEAWYQKAMASPGNDVVWTPDRREADTGKWSLAASLRLKRKENPPSPSYVVAFKVRLTDVLTLKDRLKATPDTKVFLVDEKDNVTEISLGIWPGGDAGGGNAEDMPQTADRKILSDAVKYWVSSERTTDESFAFKSGGKIWWGGLSPLVLDGQQIWVGALVPQDELLPETRKTRHLIFAMIGAVLVIGILSTLLFVHFSRGSAGGEAFSRRTLYDSEAAVLSLIRNGENSELEFKSTLRWNLKSGKPGKEIETAWLKTVAAYMNTEGGILLIGVADDGSIFGLDADDFQNDDKCLLHVNNLLKQHIGLEFSPFIRYEIVPVGDKKILALECTRSGEPVFLKDGRDETFYIRSGPSSLRLSISETLKYIKDRAPESRS